MNNGTLKLLFRGVVESVMSPQVRDQLNQVVNLAILLYGAWLKAKSCCVLTN